MRVTVNAAMSADGKIALRHNRRLRLSDDEDMRRVHEMRSASDAVLVGIGTVLADDPRLSARSAGAKQPLRVVLDSLGRTPLDARVLEASARTLIVTAEGHGRAWPHAEHVEAGKERVDLRLMLDQLQARGVQRLMVEGGATVIGAFLAARLVDEMYVYVAPVVVGGGAPSLVEGPGAELAEHVLRLRLASAGRLGEGALLRYVAR